jgi:hypothetical protein
MRHSCLDCCRKHLAQASVLMDEAYLGYPHHRWLAAGHLAEAESETLREFPDFSGRVRQMRLAIMNRTERSHPETIEDLILLASQLAGDTQDLVSNSNSSKHFDVIERTQTIRLNGKKTTAVVEP